MSNLLPLFVVGCCPRDAYLCGRFLKKMRCAGTYLNNDLYSCNTGQLPVFSVKCEFGCLHDDESDDDFCAVSETQTTSSKRISKSSREHTIL